MTALTSRWVTWWCSQAPRQQWLCLVALLVLGGGAIDTLLLAPAQQAERGLTARLEQQRATGGRLRAAADAQQQAVANLRREESALQLRLQAAEQRITQARATLSGPAVLRQRIRELSQDGALRLVSLVSEPVEAVEVGQSGSVRLYRFALTTTLEGPYAALQEHLQRLERSQQGLRWTSIKLDNTGWPAVRMEIKLVMLSDQAQWRGERGAP